LAHFPLPLPDALPICGPGVRLAHHLWCAGSGARAARARDSADALGLPRAPRQPLAFRSVPHPEPAQRIAVALADRYTVERELGRDRKSTRLNSSHVSI